MKKKLSYYLLHILFIACLSCNLQSAETDLSNPTTTDQLSSQKQPQTQEHPLLDTSFPIAWSKLTPEQIKIDSPVALDRAKQAIDAITQIPDDQLTFDNTFMAFERNNNMLDVAFSKAINLDMLVKSNAMSSALQETQPKLEEFTASLYLNDALYKKLKTFSNSSAAKSLNPLQQRFVDHTLYDFKNNGAGLQPEQKKRLLEVVNRLSLLGLQFSKNATDARNAWELIIEDPKLIEGLPELTKDRLRLDALNRGHGSEEKPNWRLTLDYTNLGPEITYIKNPATREKLWRGMYTLGSTAPYDNTPLIIETLTLRQENAHLLGKDNYADLITEDYMMKTGANALKFVENLRDKLHPLFLEQFQDLAKMPEKSGENVPNPWDILYLVDLKNQASHGFKAEDYRAYIQFDAALKALFDTDEKLYGIKVVEKPTFVAGSGSAPAAGAIEVWHPNVRFYEIYDDKNQHIASFYGDWFMRSSKRAGAWMMNLQQGTFNSDGTHTPHIMIINSDTTPENDNTPSLLSLNELRTLFHEFGHLLHGAFGNVSIGSMNGTNVAWDFVEFPSQVNEAFATEPMILQSFAHHYKTNEPLPQNMAEAAAKLAYSYAGLMRMRQLYWDKLDLALHMSNQTFTPESLNAFLDQALQAYIAPYAFKTPHPIGTFNHFLGTGNYAAGYYSYDWDNVMALDVFERFRKSGLLNPTLGMEFKNNILSQGDIEDADVLYRNFMGRDPNLEPALRTYGAKP